MLANVDFYRTPGKAAKRPVVQLELGIRSEKFDIVERDTQFFTLVIPEDTSIICSLDAPGGDADIWMLNAENENLCYGTKTSNSKDTCVLSDTAELDALAIYAWFSTIGVSILCEIHTVE